jgi:hypothetical protein
LRLHRDVEGGDRFVGDQEVGPDRQCACNADALALSARELVRIAIERTRVEPDQGQQLGRGLQRIGARRAVVHRPLDDRVADGAARIERSVRILEHDLDAAAPRAKRVAIEPCDVLSVEDDAPG